MIDSYVFPTVAKIGIISASFPKGAIIGIVSAVVGVFVVAILIRAILIKTGKIKIDSSSNNSGANNTQGGADGSVNEVIPKLTGINAEYSSWCRDNQPVIMRSPEQQNLVDKYFRVKNIVKSNKVLLVIGALVLAVGVILAVIFVATLFKNIALIVAGSILIIAGVVFLAFYKKSFCRVPPIDMISHEEYEQIVKNTIRNMNVEKKGLEHLGIDEEQIREIRPLVFTDDEVTYTSLVALDAEKNKVHSSTQTVMLVYFTDAQLFVYKLQFDLCCNKQQEWTSEFFYSDICDISTHIN
ncbi:MAG: phage holin family protein, partial [Clostridiales bacterium]|nr:phage holin family protein [Clostridiales bacterium]